MEVIVAIARSSRYSRHSYFPENRSRSDQTSYRETRFDFRYVGIYGDSSFWRYDPYLITSVDIEVFCHLLWSEMLSRLNPIEPRIRKTIDDTYHDRVRSRDHRSVIRCIEINPMMYGISRTRTIGARRIGEG